MNGKYCGMEVTEARPPDEMPLLCLDVERDVCRQAERLSCAFANGEELRRMTRQEFRRHLRERLQEFGDLILAEWERTFGESRE